MSSEQLAPVTDDEYMHDDCFFKMNEFINSLKHEEQNEEVKEDTT